jgi:predicted transcriptional regulator
MRALALKHEGWSQRTIARALGVSDPAVSHWLAVAERDGAEALRSHPPRAGSPG